MEEQIKKIYVLTYQFDGDCCEPKTFDSFSDALEAAKIQIMDHFNNFIVASFKACKKEQEDDESDNDEDQLSPMNSFLEREYRFYLEAKSRIESANTLEELHKIITDGQWELRNSSYQGFFREEFMFYDSVIRYEILETVVGVMPKLSEEYTLRDLQEIENLFKLAV